METIRSNTSQPFDPIIPHTNNLSSFFMETISLNTNIKPSIIMGTVILPDTSKPLFAMQTISPNITNKPSSCIKDTNLNKSKPLSAMDTHCSNKELSPTVIINPKTNKPLAYRSRRFYNLPHRRSITMLVFKSLFEDTVNLCKIISAHIFPKQSKDSNESF